MRILLSGYYGFGNLGDEAILAGLAHALRGRGHEPVVLSNDPEATTSQHGVTARHRLRGLLPALASADLVVSGGGGLLQDATSARSLTYYLGVLRLARAGGKRTAVFAQSLGPLSAHGRSRVAAALRGVPLFLRDRPSLDLAAELGLEAELVGDAALLLAQAPTTERSAASAVAGPGARPAAGRDEWPLVLIPRGGHDAYNEALVALARALADDGRPLAVMIMHPAEDAEPAARITAAAPGVAVWQPATAATAIERLRGSGGVASARLHGCILAAVAGTPVVGLAYDPKVTGFLELIGAPGLRAPIDTERLPAALATAQAPDEATVERLVASAQEGIDALIEVATRARQH